MLTPLDSYLSKSGTTSARFAALVGVSKQTVDNWRYGRYSPSPSYYGAITRAVIRRNMELKEAHNVAVTLVDSQYLSLLSRGLQSAIVLTEQHNGAGPVHA